MGRFDPDKQVSPVLLAVVIRSILFVIALGALIVLIAVHC